jgi:hypothetical protein
MLYYDNHSFATLPNALDGSPTHLIVRNNQLHVAGGVSGSATMVTVFVAVVVVLWLFS